MKDEFDDLFDSLPDEEDSKDKHSSLTSQGSSEQFVLPSQLKKKGRRPPKQNTPKLSVFDLDDDISSGQSKSPHAGSLVSPFSPPKSKTFSLETSLLSYLEHSMKELTNSFIDEFNYLTEKAFSLESISNKFINDLNNEIKKIVIDEFQTNSSQNPIENAQLDSKLSTQIDEQFDSIKRLIRPRDKNVEDNNPLFAADIDDIRDSLNENISNQLRELNVEISPLIQEQEEISKIQLKKQFRNLKMKSEYLMEMSRQIDLESEYVDDKLRKLEEKQSIFRQNQMKNMDSELVVYNQQDYSSYLREFIDNLREKQNEVSDDVLDNSVDMISKETNEIVMNIDQALYRYESLSQTVAKYKKLQWDELQFMEEQQQTQRSQQISQIMSQQQSSIHERESSILSNSYIQSEQPDSSVLSKVRERLKSIQQSRAEAQFDIDME